MVKEYTDLFIKPACTGAKTRFFLFELNKSIPVILEGGHKYNGLKFLPKLSVVKIWTNNGMRKENVL